MGRRRKMASSNPTKIVDEWIQLRGVVLEGSRHATRQNDDERLQPIDACLEGARVVFLGETNHFVKEKTTFRLWWLERLAREHRLVVGEELGWSDGRRVAAYLRDGDARHLDRVATFGYTGHLRRDRDDRPTGVFAASESTYPHALMKQEHVRFYAELRSFGAVSEFFGFDIDSPGGGYEDVLALRGKDDFAGMTDEFWRGLARVEGETLGEEAARLRRLCERHSEEPGFGALREDLRSLVESLEYTALVNPAQSYEATRPAMAYREESMKRRVSDVLSRIRDDELLVLMAHAFHLAKDDARMQGTGIGPGGGRVTSLGHYLTQERGLDTASVWMIYGSGRDSQPLADLPRNARYPRDSLNRLLLRHGNVLVLPVARGCPLQGNVKIGHLYNAIETVDLCAQADAIMFFPKVSPLDAQTDA